ncbi:MAG: desulfoferrodoxin family protein [Candidatus Falkowbacteria bacterium]|nr:desulfoferrodoxin family protein [Candidatus Falkowbacteria bacterium]
MLKKYVLHVGADVICCGHAMKLIKANTVDASQEKHVPVIETGNGKIVVKVGSIAHPMEEAHFIEWIEIEVDGTRIRKDLQPGDLPQMEISIGNFETVSARAYCNLHGLWKS